MSYTRITTVWNGKAGLPGYTRLKFNGELTGAQALTAATAMRAFWDTMKEWFPSGMTLTVQPELEIFDISQQLTGSVVVAAPAVVTGTSVLAYSAATGAHIRWVTGAVANGRRVSGRTFLVPLVLGAFDGDGTLTANFLSALNGALATFFAAQPGMIIATHYGETFAQFGVTGYFVPDKAAVLRSRRD